MTAAEVKAIRNAAGLTQTELARLLRISDIRTIRRWEVGDVPISGPASIIMGLIAEDQLPAKYWEVV